MQVKITSNSHTLLAIYLTLRHMRLFSKVPVYCLFLLIKCSKHVLSVPHVCCVSHVLNHALFIRLNII